MGDQEARKGLFLLHLVHGLPQIFAGEGIKRPEGLIENQHLGLMHQRTAQGRALPHAARKLRGTLVLKPTQTHKVEQKARALFLLRTGQFIGHDLQG